MSKSKHTPGPWFVFDNKCCVGGPLADRSPEDPAHQTTAGIAMCGMRMRWPDEAEANARLIAASPELLDALTAPTWLVWSNEHAAWWGPNHRHYFTDIKAAGRYTLEEAIKITRSRSLTTDPGVNPSELIQPSPEWIAARVAAIAKAMGGK